MATRLTAAQKRAEAAEYLAKLRKLCRRGATILTVKRKHVAYSGACEVDFYLFKISKGKIERFWLSYMIAKALGHRFVEKRDAVWLPYMNMDPAFAVISNLSRKLGYENENRLKSEWL